ncbi:hypothetical protein NDU88_002480 [Pleurodeles waltl]|uniref:Uncharacterized protein n=1 Tax=Pleurodeles waltl TaxID=8319 RepID=A0AAV7RFV5_PLEWA|nr:hypothetical protein NDU88_002480 [Pleurodeles waltl]
MHDRASLSHHPGLPPPVALGGFSSTLMGSPGPRPHFAGCGVREEHPLALDCSERGRSAWTASHREKMVAPNAADLSASERRAPGSKDRLQEAGSQPKRLRRPNV